MNYHHPKRPQGLHFPLYVLPNGESTGVEILMPGLVPVADDFGSNHAYQMSWSLPTETRGEYTIKRHLVVYRYLTEELDRFINDPEMYLSLSFGYSFALMDTKSPKKKVEKFTLDDLV